MSEFHPDLKLARFIPTPGGGERLARVVRRFKVPAARVPDDMSVENVTVPGRNGGPDVRLRFYRPRAISGVTPSLLWMHGGGYFMGNVEQDDRRSMTIARSLGITVAALRAALFGLKSISHRSPDEVRPTNAASALTHPPPLLSALQGVSLGALVFPAHPEWLSF